MTKTLSLLLSALLLLLAGCSSRPDRIPTDARVSVSSLFSADEQEGVLAAIEAWRVATNGRTALRVHIGGDDASELVIRPGRADPGAVAYTDIASNDTALMIIDSGALSLTGQDLQTSVEHELGHAFGLDHLEGTLMAAAPPRGVLPVDAVTVGRFEENYR